VVQIWPGLFLFKSGDISPGHIWTTLYIQYDKKNIVSLHKYIYIYIYIYMKPVFKWKQKLFTINFNADRQLVLRSNFCISANFVDQDHWMWRSERLPDSAVGNKLKSGDEPAPSQRDRSVGQLLRHDEPYVHAANDTSLHSAWRDRWTARSQI